MAYKFLEHTADIAVEVTADSLERLFGESALAWKEAVLEEYETQDELIKQIYKLEYSLEELLVSFLDELNFSLLTKKWVFNNVEKIQINQNKKEWELQARLTGEDFNSSRHNIKEEIKAVTFHQMKIEKKNNEFITKIVFDI